MRVALAVLVLATLALAPAGAQPDAPARTDSAARYWIFLAERPADAPAVTPTAHALARRALRGAPSQPVRPDAGVSPRHLDALRALGVAPRVQSRWMNAVSADMTPDVLARVRALPFVRGVQRVARLAEARTPPPAAPPEPLAVETRGGVAYGPSEFQLRFVNAHRTLDEGRSGAGVVLGFLDTLFDFAHPAMAPIPADGRLLGVQDFTGGQPQDSYHGLSTSSVAAGFFPGELVGPAHGATVLAATTEYAPTETHAEEDYFVAGLEWLEANGVDVVSISLGYSLFDEGEGDFTYEDMDGNTTVFTRAVDRAASLGVIVVCSAGNEGENPWHFITAPADADSVITVGAAGMDSLRAGFSGFGPTADGRTKPDVAALGTNVYLASPGGYDSGGGTSFSAPMVAGIVAQMLEANPGIGPMTVLSLLRSTASQASAPDNELGWGIVDAEAVVNVIIESGTELPAPEHAFRIYPSVFSSGTPLTAVFEADASAPFQTEVFDVLGRRLAEGADGAARAGMNRVSLRVPPLAPGAYLLRLHVGERVETQRLTVVR